MRLFLRHSHLHLIPVAALPDTTCRITDLQRWLQTFYRLHGRMQHFLCRMGLFLYWYSDLESRKVFSTLVVTVRNPITAPAPPLALLNATARDRVASFPNMVSHWCTGDPTCQAGPAPLGSSDAPRNLDSPTAREARKTTAHDSIPRRL